MSVGLMKMWFSFGAIALMFVAVTFILLSRHKMKNKFFKGLTAIFAYACMIVSGLIIFLIVFSGPVEQ